MESPDVKKFLNDAGKPVEEMGKEYPWEEPGLRDDVKKKVLVTMPEKQKMKLDYIIATKPESINQLINNLIDGWIIKELKI
jgi:hypothetical protein|tara:strand:- start:910 stop:1152 length:243 start_codon:yes stop_codon:yes gene_type:complete